MRLGPLLEERSAPVEVGLVVVGPIVAGVVAGFLAAESKLGYVIISILAAAGAFLAGTEHRTAVEGAYRGLLAGLEYGVALLTTLDLRGKAAKVNLPDHILLVAVIAAVVSVALAALGGAARSRAQRRLAGATPPARPR